MEDTLLRIMINCSVSGTAKFQVQEEVDEVNSNGRRDNFDCPRPIKKYGDSNWGCRSSKGYQEGEKIQKICFSREYRSSTSTE
ncbi:hypothetical protein L3X38_008896 [Prunus dulcis]|uniref:Uncharacterized protein n=1 Tax=Prunus dulcis TaxID=3755 RepID=A0AAD4ZXQ5_PRUDU|nr:hypothetical protein L3X38_008896 [Prunus dulcis]